eukprot:TRINITY_DN395_c0_g1_i1.p1 TRINITY_DN395_c0_g1~~TRINITY_DN395_c0_g1_i1.p1  ORF type:complete len:417 (+),score=125.48 TRINITY_DN395_c0_g1_i1:120-1370(+)
MKRSPDPPVFRVCKSGSGRALQAVHEVMVAEDSKGPEAEAEHGPEQQVPKARSLMPLPPMERRSSLQNLFPEVCAKYQPLGIIGGGAYGVVCKAKTEDGTLVAIKRIPGVLKDAQEARRALREIKLLKHFDKSPYVVDFVDVVRTKDGAISSLLLVFELMHSTLHSLVDKHRKAGSGVPPDTRKRLAVQLLRGMRDLHSVDVVHRDLRPKNLLIKDGTLKICDFGMARKVNLRMSLLCYTTCSSYCAPEGMLANNNTYTVASDMWSVGCILFEMMTGKRLFKLKPTQGSTPLHRMVEMLGVPTAEDMEAINASSKYQEIADEMRQGVEEATPAPVLDALREQDEKEVDLLLRFLAYNPARRISAVDALSHPYFEGVEPDSPQTFAPFEHEEAPRPLISDIQREMRHELLTFPSYSM